MGNKRGLKPASTFWDHSHPHFGTTLIPNVVAGFSPRLITHDMVAYFGCLTSRRYGLSVFHPWGYLALASSSLTAGTIMQSPPSFQFAGVATLCAAVNWIESITRRISSKLRPVVIGYVIISLIFLSGPM